MEFVLLEVYFMKVGLEKMGKVKRFYAAKNFFPT